MNRRAFLRQLAFAGAGTALAGCASSPSTTQQSQRSPATATADPGAAAIRRVAPDARSDLAVVAATYEQLLDQPNPFVFGLFTLERQPLPGADAQVYAIPSSGEPLGPWPATPSAADVPPGALYTVAAEFEAEGLHELVVVTADRRAGAVAIAVRDAQSSSLPAPGHQALAVATPTTAEPLGYQTLCTRDRPCGMHEVSLDKALAGSTPVVLLFATPAFCQTAVCGPTVDVLEHLRQDHVSGRRLLGPLGAERSSATKFGDVTFIHCEIFKDAGQTVGDPVVAWNLPTEPWLFVIAADGTIARRADGPLLVVADELRSLIGAGLAAEG